MSSSKRHFTAVVGSKEHGLYISSSPSSAARKIVSKLCASSKSKKVEFCVREITQGSKKKTYGPYLGEMKKLAKPIELKGRIIRYDIKVLLKKKKTATKTAKKIGKKMRGGDIDTDGILTANDFFIRQVQNSKNIENFSMSKNRVLIKLDPSGKEYIFFGFFIDSSSNVNNLYYRYVVCYDKQKKFFFNFSKSKILIKFKQYNIENGIEDIENIGFIDKSALEILRIYIESNSSDFCIELKKILKGINTGRSFMERKTAPSQFGTLYGTRQ